MRDQRGRGRFAVGAGNRDEWRIRRVANPLPAKQFDVPDHLDTSLLRREYGPVRRRMSKWRARRQHQRREICPRYLAQIRGDEPGPRGFGEFVDPVIAGDHFSAARFQRVTAREPGAAEPEHRNRLARKGGDGDQIITAVSASRGRQAPASPR